MEQSKTSTYIISGVVALAVIALIAGAYIFDHRFDDEMMGDSATNASTSLSTTASSSAASTSAVSMPSMTNAMAKIMTGSNGANGDPQFITLKTHTMVNKSDTSYWKTYTNVPFKFSLKYPGAATVRSFVDGGNIDYGIGLSLRIAGSRYAEKYFELTTDSGKTTMCDALLDENTTAEAASINGVQFIRRQYSEGTSQVVEYVGKAYTSCYRGYLRLNTPTVATITTANIKTEFQVLEDIMSTFTLAK